MVNTRYHLRILYSENGTPPNCEYTNNYFIVTRRTMEHILNGSEGEGEEEYYCEYDNLGVFIYTKDNKIIKSRTWIQDFKIKGFTTQYKPDTTITYIKQSD